MSEATKQPARQREAELSPLCRNKKMSHLIEKPFDKVLSTQGTEWHGLADVVPSICKETAAPLFFPILEGTPILKVDGADTPMENWKVIAADLRQREDLLALVGKDGFTAGDLIRPLHVPKKGYEVISNLAVWEGMMAALGEVKGSVTTIGTLAGCRRFFISFAIEGEEKIALPNGEECLAYVNFITSHDGTLACEAYDSSVRIVCNNTLQWSRDAAGEVGFKMYHTKGSAAQVSNMGALIAEILAGRATYTQTMGELAAQNCTVESAEKIVAGYFAMIGQIKDGNPLAKRSQNATEDIVSLAWNGRGNKGGTLYDVLNGFTEYYSEGDGSGKGTGNKREAAEKKGRKMFSANFGNAMEHKRDFLKMVSSPGTLQKMRIQGGKVLTAAKSIIVQEGKI